MKFGEALEHLKDGERVTREGWNGKDMFLFLVPGSHFTVNRAPLLGIYPEGTGIDYRSHIDMKTAQGDVVPWVASQSDLLENDWLLYASKPSASDEAAHASVPGSIDDQATRINDLQEADNGADEEPVSQRDNDAPIDGE